MSPFVHLSVQELASASHEAYIQQCETAADLAFELFCRALDKHDQHAWRVIQQTYLPMVKSWIGKTVAGISEFDADDIVQLAYTKFWRSLSRDHISVREQFPHLGSILKYLNQCVVTTAIDYLRKKQRLARLDDRLFEQNSASFAHYDPIRETCERTERINYWIQNQVIDPDERLLLKLLYEYDLKPLEIVRTFPEEFPDQHHVRRVRDRVMKRARRALVNTAVSH
jgi:RNA polymerase sigma factor (sigma-70 family)